MEHLNNTDLDLLAMLDDFISDLDPDIIRRATSVASYQHKCSGSLHRCCSQQFCNTCYIEHLKSKHGQHAAMFYYKLSVASTTTWPAKRAVIDRSSKPVRITVKPKEKKARQLRLNELSVDQAVDLLDLIKLQLGGEM